MFLIRIFSYQYFAQSSGLKKALETRSNQADSFLFLLTKSPVVQMLVTEFKDPSYRLPCQHVKALKVQGFFCESQNFNK